MKKFPFRSQMESADCGPACIQMIAAYYGKQFSLETLKKYCQMTRQGISLKDILDGCHACHLKAMAIKISLDQLQQMPLPAILYWKQEHYVVLYQTSYKKGKWSYYIADPAYGKTKLSENIFQIAWNQDKTQGIAIIVTPEKDFFAQPEERQTFQEQIKTYFSTFQYLKNYKKKLGKILLLATIVFICNLIIPFLLQKVMDEGIALKNISWVVSLLLGQVTLNIGSLISSATNNYLLYQTGLNIGMDISRQYVEKLVKLPLQLFDTKLGTDFLQRLNDEERIRTFLMYIANSFIFIILNVFVYSCILLYYNTYVFLIFIFFGCLGILITRWILHIRKQIDYTLFVSLGKKRNIENELVYGMTEIKINKAHLSFVHQWKELQTDINKLLLRSSLYGTGISNGVSFFNIIRDTLITGGCAWLVIENKMSIGIMMTITYLLGQLSSSVNQITQFSHTAQDAILAYKRMEDILKIPDENEGKQPYSQLSSKNGFFLKNVSFKYDGSFNPYVLKNINAEIPIGKVTAIVGASGSGKTTLLKLLLAFYYPQQGNIKVMGKDMKELNVDLWRDKCGAVMQEGYIFSGSIADNIALSSLSKQIDMERIKHAAQIACLDSFIEHLPMKYYTKIGKSGMELSGGQKQRILIARAVYKNPEFIFFDEATSSLDASNEKEIMEHLKIFYQNRTVIIIAHRLSTVRDADNIIVLENGSLIEQGSHQELIKKEGAYYKLIKNQLELGQ